MAAKHEHIAIEGDQATWHNEWIAAGNKIKWEMVHYDVQLIGGMVLHQGKIAEMATGEGKTLVATLPAFLNALCKKRSTYCNRQRLPRQTGLGMDGPIIRISWPYGGLY